MIGPGRRQGPDLAVLMAELGKGGMGKMRLQLINGIVSRGFSVDLLVVEGDNEYQTQLDERVRVVHLPTSHALFGVPSLAAYLWRHRPGALLTQRLRVNQLAHRARATARVGTRIYATGNTHISTHWDHLDPAERRRRLAKVRRYFPRNDGLIAVSQGVAEDLERVTGADPDIIAVAPNPVVTPGLDEAAREPVEHPWFQPGEPPVILGVGRLQTQKDFPNLVRAFARLRRDVDARLVILGKGPKHDQIWATVREEGVEAYVDLPGFARNPYAYIARSRLFALSSAWEGSPNVLTEAMAVGTPVVATDCPAGPAEILDHGRYGPLVPVGEPDALAAAMRQICTDPPDTSAARKSVHRRFSQEASADAFIRAMRLTRTDTVGADA